jgi:LCP family protein required for cell wall assembly
LAPANGHPYPPAIQFADSIPVPDQLTFVLFVGSDARAGEDVTAARGDSLHLLAINPATGAGTMVGIPRDSWVDIPGHGSGKINSALSLGGPELLAETVRNLTGLPVEYYVITGFEGFQAIVDELGGLMVEVNPAMDDDNSGARFEAGYHSFTGGEALAYGRNRYTVPRGDFDRSFNQGRLLMAGLAKLRAETSDAAGLRKWIRVLMAHAVLQMPLDKLEGLAALARHIDPDRLTNVVAPGGVGYAGSQSVVFLNDDAAAIFVDMRDDAVLGTPPPPPPPSSSEPGSGGPAGPDATTTSSTGAPGPPSTTGPPATTPPSTSEPPPPTTVPPTTAPPTSSTLVVPTSLP